MTFTDDEDGLWHFEFLSCKFISDGSEMRSFFMSKPKSTGYMFLLYCNETPKGESFNKNKLKLKLKS